MLQLNLQFAPALQTERLVLRDLKETDIPQLFELRSNDELMRFIDRDKAQTEEDAKIFYQRLKSGQSDNTGISWAVTLKGDDTMVGNIGFFNIQKEHHRAELGYFLHPKYHRKGLMAEAIKAVTNFAFSDMNVHSIEANINPENEASKKLLQKMGFVQEAYFRENFYFNGRFLDSAIYCLIVSDVMG